MRIVTTALLTGLLCLAPPQLAAASLYGYDGDGSGAPSATEGGIERAVTQYDAQPYRAYRKNRLRQQGGRRVIPPSVALQVALSYSPGSQALGVSLLRGPRLMYSVKLKSGNQILRVLVDAQTAQVVGP